MELTKTRAAVRHGPPPIVRRSQSTVADADCPVAFPSMGLIVIVLGVLIGVFIRYVLKRPGIRDDDSPQDPRRWTSGWF